VTVVKIVSLFGITCLGFGCVTEDTTPSSALFPTTGQYTSASIGASVPKKSDRPDFTRMLNSNAARKKVELSALFGFNYLSSVSRSVTASAWEEIESGTYQAKDGKQAYRIHTISQAQQILKYNWTQEDWSANSDLAKAFQKLPNVSVVKLSATDQRIFFFNEANRFVGCYPAAR